MKGKVKFINGDKELYENYSLGQIIGRGNSMVFEATSKDGKIIDCVKEMILSDNPT